MTRGFKLLSFCLLLFVIGCANNKGKYSVLDPSDSKYYKGISAASIQSMPASFEEYAISSNGKLLVKGELLTSGPLADISADEVSMENARSVISGSIIARKASISKNVRIARRNAVLPAQNRSPISIRSVETALHDAGTVDAYILRSDGNVYLRSSGVETQSSLSVLPGTWVYDPSTSTWSVDGKSITISSPLICETNMIIKGKNVVCNSSLYVKGSFSSDVNFKIDTQEPFNTAFVVDGNVSIHEATIVGKVEVGRTLTVSTLLDLIGTLKVEGNISLDGCVKINYLDTVYKAALVDINSRLGSDVFLVHSQVFSDVNNNNAVALFTFVNGNKKLTEDSIFRMISNGTLNSSDYVSIIQGSSLDFATSLEHDEGLSSYYINKLHVLKTLDSQGHPDVYISESLFVAPDCLYHTFTDSDTGVVIGTYQVFGGGLVYNDTSALVELTSTARQSIVRSIVNARDCDSPASVDPGAAAAINSMSATDVQAQLDQGTATAAANQIAALTQAFPENPISIDQATALVTSQRSGAMSGEDRRTEEWRSAKSVEITQKNVMAEVEVVEDGASSTNRNCMRFSVRKACKRVCKTVTKTVTKTVPSVSSTIALTAVTSVISTVNSLANFVYQNHTDIRFVKGVDSSDADDWTKYFALLNIGGYNQIGGGRCGQISAMMIIRYNGGEVYNDLAMNAPAATNADRYAPTQSSVNNIRVPLLDMINNSSDNKIWNVAAAVDTQLKKYNRGMSAKWKWWLAFGASDYIGAGLAGLGFGIPVVTELHCAIAYDEIQGWVKSNSPGMIQLNGKFDWTSTISWNMGHTMPVIGYKHEINRVCGIPIIGLDKKYVYVHTTWNYGQDFSNTRLFADKRFIRFDWYANPNSETNLIQISR